MPNAPEYAQAYSQDNADVARLVIQHSTGTVGAKAIARAGHKGPSSAYGDRRQANSPGNLYSMKQQDNARGKNAKVLQSLSPKASGSKDYYASADNQNNLMILVGQEQAARGLSDSVSRRTKAQRSSHMRTQ